MPVKRLLYLFLIAVMILLPGCWSYEELEERAIVTALGADLEPDGKLVVSVQVVRPFQFGIQRTPQSGASKSPVKIFTATGKSMDEAIMKIQQQTGRKIFFSFMEAVIIGEDLARDDIMRLTDWVLRHREVRLQTWFGTARGKARDVIRATDAGLEVVSGFYIGRTLVISREEDALIPATSLFDFSSTLAGKITCPVTFKIHTTKKRPRISGGAVYRRSRLVGWLNDEETRGYLWVTGRVERGIVTTPLPGGGHASFEIRGHRTKLKPEMRGKRPAVRLSLTVKGNVDEVHDPDLLLDKPSHLKKLEKIMARQITREVEASLRRARELRADVFGFGQLFRRHQPAEWASMEDNWEDIFPLVPVQIEVKVILRRTEQIGRPLAENTGKFYN